LKVQELGWQRST